MITKSEATHKLWELGVLTWKLDENQKQVQSKLLNSESKIVVFAASRRIGKSFLLCTIGIEQCLQRANSTVIYVAPTIKMVRTITKTIMRDILKDCPKSIRPKYHSQEKTWKFTNGSELQFAGADAENIESVRGSEGHLVLVDEAGFISDLKYSINSVLLPTTTTTKGKIVLASTPPKSASHDFVTYLEKAKLDGTLVKKTIYDNPRLLTKDIDMLAQEVGGYDSVDFKREYLAEIITDASKAVIPEFTDTLEKKVVRSWDKPPHYDAYVAMDLGFRDFTVVLFAYYDFLSEKIIVEDEFVINGNSLTTEVLAHNVKIKEKICWGEKAPLMRISDNNLIVINDLSRLHGLFFIPANKDDNDAAINYLRMMLGGEKIIIDPKCKTLIYHLKNAIWKANRQTFDYGVDGSHFDGVDALKYLIRNVNTSKNPYPGDYNLSKADAFYSNYYKEQDNSMTALLKKLYINKSK